MGGAPLRLSGCICPGMLVAVDWFEGRGCLVVSVELCMSRHARGLLRRLGVMPGPYIESHLIVQRRTAPVADRCCNTATFLLSQRIPGWDLIKGDHMDGSAQRPRGRWIMGDSQQNSATPNTDFSVPGKLAVSAIPVTPTYPATPTAPQQAQPPSTSNPTRLNHRSPLSSPATAKRNRFRFCSSASTN